MLSQKKSKRPLTERNLRHLAGNIRIIVTDFDGVWTDGKVLVGQNGDEYVVCSRRDTLRINEINNSGVKIAVISKEKNPVVSARCAKMGVECFQGKDDKAAVLKALLERENIKPEETVYVGDDINDLECLNMVGLPIALADSEAQCKESALYVTHRKGGDHAMREVFDLVIAAKKN